MFIVCLYVWLDEYLLVLLAVLIWHHFVSDWTRNQFLCHWTSGIWVLWMYEVYDLMFCLPDLARNQLMSHWKSRSRVSWTFNIHDHFALHTKSGRNQFFSHCTIGTWGYRDMKWIIATLICSFSKCENNWKMRTCLNITFFTFLWTGELV